MDPRSGVCRTFAKESAIPWFHSPLTTSKFRGSRLRVGWGVWGYTGPGLHGLGVMGCRGERFCWSHLQNFTRPSARCNLQKNYLQKHLASKQLSGAETLLLLALLPLLVLLLRLHVLLLLLLLCSCCRCCYYCCCCCCCCSMYHYPYSYPYPYPQAPRLLLSQSCDEDYHYYHYCQYCCCCCHYYDDYSDDYYYYYTAATIPSLFLALILLFLPLLPSPAPVLANDDDNVYIYYVDYDFGYEKDCCNNHCS